MASFPPPISILSLSAESGTLVLVIIGLVLPGSILAQAVHGPDVLRSEEDWLERVHTFHLPRLLQMEEDIYTKRLRVWEAIDQQLQTAQATAAEILENRNRRPIRQYRFAGVPFLINR